MQLDLRGDAALSVETIGQVSLAISPARRPALAESKTMTRSRSP
jgi:hypothetical protein